MRSLYHQNVYTQTERDQIQKIRDVSIKLVKVRSETEYDDFEGVIELQDGEYINQECTQIVPYLKTIGYIFGSDVAKKMWTDHETFIPWFVCKTYKIKARLPMSSNTSFHMHFDVLQLIPEVEKIVKQQWVDEGDKINNYFMHQ